MKTYMCIVYNHNNIIDLIIINVFILIKCINKDLESQVKFIFL